MLELTRLLGYFPVRSRNRNSGSSAPCERRDTAHSISHCLSMFSHSIHAYVRHRQSHCWPWSNVSIPHDNLTDFRAEFMGPLKGNPGYEGFLNDRVATLPEVMKDGHYSTIMSGKWHLGTTKDQCPSAKGFEQVFSLLQGGTSFISDKANVRWQSLPNRVANQGWRPSQRCGLQKYF